MRVGRSAAAGLLLGNFPGLMGDLSYPLAGSFLFLGLGDGNSALDFFGHELESFVNVLAVLRRSLQEADVVVLSKFFSFFERNLALVLHIGLVADENARNVV